MGSSASKAARAAPRKYPTTANLPQAARSNKPPASTPSDHARGPAVPPGSGFINTRDASINEGAADPDFTSPPNAAFSSRLRQIGPVQPSPTLSHSAYPPASPLPSSHYPHGTGPPDSAARINPTLLALQSRARLEREAAAEFEEVARLGTGKPRRFLDVASVRTVLSMRDEEGKTEGEIERALGLEKGVVGRLGRGVVSGAELVGERSAA